MDTIFISIICKKYHRIDLGNQYKTYICRGTLVARQVTRSIPKKKMTFNIIIRLK